ncbi:hypothetical protein VP01_170g5 [Puccinia sorghi]|uniref:Uncharacterized protein n=1 Tax=Puccinia sorghi TaxID=27349 RepID=A0A0L6VHE3_9BASI|nr:hypothetical protein VP01_170g5 [Puccinia sorghi]
MVSLLERKPGLLLDEILKRLYNVQGTLLRIKAVHKIPVSRFVLVAKYKTFKKHSSYLPSSWSSPVSMGSFLLFTSVILTPSLTFQTDETAICNRDLLRKHAHSILGAPVACKIIKQNSQRISLLPSISLNGILPMAVTSNMFNFEKWEDFLEWDLVNPILFLIRFLECTRIPNSTQSLCVKMPRYIRGVKLKGYVRWLVS